MSDKIPTAVPNQSPVTEEWRPVVGYEGLYSVSDQGRVMSHHDWRGRGGVNRILPPIEIWNGYLSVWLSKKGTKRSRQLIHRLMLLAFIGPCPNKTQVNHKDGNRKGNHLPNLEWCDQSENQRHRHDVLKHGALKGSKHGCAKLTEADVIEIRRLIGQMTGRAIAKQFNISAQSICRIKRRLNWTHI